MKATCSVDGCENPVKTRGLCNKHHLRWLRNGDPNVVLRDESEIPYSTQFGRLTVWGLDHRGADGKAFYYCRCSCGRHVVVSGASLKNGDTRSCGCLDREVKAERFRKHGLHGSLTYESVISAMRRCTNPKATRYERYGGANPPVEFRYGDTIEEAVANVIADIGERPPGTSLGRFGDEGHYEPGNCAWQTDAEQAAEAKKKRSRKEEA